MIDMSKVLPPPYSIAWREGLERAEQTAQYIIKAVNLHKLLAEAKGEIDAPETPRTDS